MSFTDEDLKETKRRLKEWPDIDVCNYFEDANEVEALIARLEAAEHCVKALENHEMNVYCEIGEEPCVDAWRKAAGK